MNDRFSWRATTLIMIAALAIPVAMLLLGSRYGGIAVVIGLLVAYRAFRVRQFMAAFPDNDDDSAAARRAAARQNQGRTIYVPLLDDAGAPLDPAVAEQRLARARMLAGPRETVVGVERTPAEIKRG